MLSAYALLRNTLTHFVITSRLFLQYQSFALNFILRPDKLESKRQVRLREMQAEKELELSKRADEIKLLADVHEREMSLKAEEHKKELSKVVRRCKLYRCNPS